MSPNEGGRGGDAVSRPMSTAVHTSPNKLWRSNFIFNLCTNILMKRGKKFCGVAAYLLTRNVQKSAEDMLRNPPNGFRIVER